MTDTLTIPIRPEFDYAQRLQAAMAQRPAWAESLTLASATYHVRVTYSDNPAFGGTISQNVAYLERHGLKDIRVTS